jgi:CBS domain-containing protein
MNSGQATYEHLKGIRERRVDNILSSATTIEPSFTISKIISNMLENDSYDVFCIDKNSVFTINARDLLDTRDISKMKVDSLLRKIQPLSKNDTIEKAAIMMTHYRMRSAPVVDNNEIIGVVRAKNIVELLAQQNLKWITSNTILTPDPITISSKEHLAKARSIMITKRIDHLPVIQDSKVSHVITSMHMLQLITPEQRIGSDQKGLNQLRRLESPVGNIGSTRIPQCRTNDSLSTVIESMLKTDTTCCLITLWDNLHGIITYKDLLNLLETKIPSEVPLYIVGLPEDMSNAEIVRTKFQKIIANLTKVYPEVEEARASIKTIHGGPVKERQHFEVTLRVITPYRTYSYTEIDWDLSKVFDALGRRIIRNLSKRGKKRWKMSVRKIDKNQIF